MLFTVIKKNTYQDSINLMLLTNRINELDGVQRSQIMMGTDANKDICKTAGLLTEEAAGAEPSDLMIVVCSEDPGIVERVLEETDRFLLDLSSDRQKTGAEAVHSWEEALEKLPDARGPIDRGGLKQLTAVLKDLHDLLGSEDGAGAVTVDWENGLDEFAR